MKDTTITQKGQVTIPVEVRRALGLEPRDRVRFEVDAERGVAVLRRTESVADLLFGAAEGAYRAPEGRTLHDAVERGVADEVVNETG